MECPPADEPGHLGYVGLRGRTIKQAYERPARGSGGEHEDVVEIAHAGVYRRICSRGYRLYVFAINGFRFNTIRISTPIIFRTILSNMSLHHRPFDILEITFAVIWIARREHFYGNAFKIHLQPGGG